jgi:hypothetical protein
MSGHKKWSEIRRPTKPRTAMSADDTIRELVKTHTKAELIELVVAMSQPLDWPCAATREAPGWCVPHDAHWLSKQSVCNRIRLAAGDKGSE